DDDVVTGFHEASNVPYWVNCGIYVLSAEALERFPEKGDHESSTFPELAEEGKLRAFRHTGLWLTVNTPKELRRADEHVSANPAWRRRGRRAGKLESGVARVKSRYAVEPRRVEKPWGWELVWAEADAYVGKLLFVRAGQALSLQYNAVKAESWCVREGRATLERGEVGVELETIEIEAGDAFRYR